MSYDQDADLDDGSLLQGLETVMNHAIWRGTLTSPDDPKLMQIATDLAHMQGHGIVYAMAIAGRMVPQRFNSADELECDLVDERPLDIERPAAIPLGSQAELTPSEITRITTSFHAHFTGDPAAREALLSRALDRLKQYKTEWITAEMLTTGRWEVDGISNDGHIILAQGARRSTRLQMRDQRRRWSPPRRRR